MKMNLLIERFVFYSILFIINFFIFRLHFVLNFKFFIYFLIHLDECTNVASFLKSIYHYYDQINVFNGWLFILMK